MIMRRYEVTKEDNRLIEEAYSALEKAKEPGNFYHTVGCCLKLSDGSLYHGVNCDCIHGSCAEFVAVGNAISDGRRGSEFDTIVSAPPDGAAGLFAACGNCRQMLMGYSPQIKVILADENGEIIKTDIGELLPFALTRLKTGDLMH